MRASIGFKARLVSMLLRLVTLGLIVVAIMISTEGIFVVLLLFVLVVPLRNVSHVTGAKRLGDLLDTDVGYALASAYGSADGVCGDCHRSAQPRLDSRPPSRIYVAKIPEAYMPVVGFLLFDALVYWTHRFYHEIPVLWKFHAIHHSTEHLPIGPVDFGLILWMGTILAPAFVFLCNCRFFLPN